MANVLVPRGAPAAALAALLAQAALGPAPAHATAADLSGPDWHREVVYQIYPRSFADGDGDGVGDLKGILGKVDYLKELGVDVVWLCPVNRTTHFDNGYDVSDYLDIDPTFGTLADYEALRDALHARGMKLMLDLVLNHSSDQHPWFQQEIRLYGLIRQLDPAPPGADRAAFERAVGARLARLRQGLGGAEAPAGEAQVLGPVAAELDALVREGQRASQLGYPSLHAQLNRLERAALGSPAERAEARHSRHDFYLWTDTPNNWTSIFSGSAWHWVPQAGRHYLALFSEHQPDLNWRNPAVRAAMAAIVKIWVERGVDGFRLDSVGFLGKHGQLPDAPPSDRARTGRGMRYFANLPEVHTYLHELAEDALADAPLRTVGEISFSPAEEALHYAGRGRGELAEVFLFDHMYVDMGRDKWDVKPFRLPVFKQVLGHQQRALHGQAWVANYLENHDQLRAVSRFGDDGHHRMASAKMLATLLMTLEGTPYIYQGQEIGMTNGHFAHIEEVDDIEAKNFYQAAVAAGEPPERVMRAVAARNRDNVRTVMQWDMSPFAGFSVHPPWIAVNSNYPTVNVAQARADPNSILAYYKRLIGLRKASDSWVHGTFEDLLPRDPHLFVYRRALPGEATLVMLNFSGQSRPVPASLAPLLMPPAQLVVGNLTAPAGGRLSRPMAPFEARVVRLRPGLPAQ